MMESNNDLRSCAQRLSRHRIHPGGSTASNTTWDLHPASGIVPPVYSTTAKAAKPPGGARWRLDDNQSSILASIERRVGLSALILITLLAGCGVPAPANSAATAAVTEAAALPKVATTKPVRRTITQKTEQPGQIHAFRTTPIHAKIGGFVAHLNVDIGDKVKGPKLDAAGTIAEPGQILAVLSAPELEEELHQKEAMVAQVAAEVLQSEAAIKVALSMEVSAKAGVEEFAAGQERAAAHFERWKSERNRMQTLADAKTVTAKLAEETELQFKSADASRTEATARLKSAQAHQNEAAVSVEKARADHLAVQSHLKVAEADRDRVSALRDYLQIRAPFDGIITERFAHPGALAGPSSPTPLLRLEQVSRLRLVVAVPESEVGGMVRNARVPFSVPAYPGQTFQGTVARIGRVLDPKTRTMPVELDVMNGAGKLSPGMFPEVTWPVRMTTASTLVPPTAVVTNTARTFVIRVRAGKAEWVTVRRGKPAGDLLEVAGDVAPGDRVVKAATDEIRDGAPVTVKAAAKK